MLRPSIVRLKPSTKRPRSELRVSAVRAAELTGRHEHTIRRQIASKNLPAKKAGREWSIRVIDLQRLYPDVDLSTDRPADRAPRGPPRKPAKARVKPPTWPRQVKITVDTAADTVLKFFETAVDAVVLAAYPVIMISLLAVGGAWIIISGIIEDMSPGWRAFLAIAGAFLLIWLVFCHH